MEKIRNLSLKSSIVLYMAVSLLFSFLLSAVIVRTATYTQQQVWQKYADDGYYEAAENREEGYEVIVSRPNQSQMSEMDWHISELCDFLETYTVLIVSIAGSFIAVGLFYRNKIKVPIEELNKASRMIAENELEFQITYENRDELGRLCREFEKMRGQLEENNRTLWRMVEDERALRAAIAHDIRSPLSVLSGYQETLLEFIPEETLDKEQIIDMLKAGRDQIGRMNRFIETMRNMTRLEDRELEYTDVDVEVLAGRIQEAADIICCKTGKQCTVRIQTGTKVFGIDSEVVLEVAENLLSNALRYAKEKTEVILTSAGQELTITVQDDGQGFTEDPDTLTKAFYHSNPQDDLKHFGMGMYISRIYCEKHGGRLLTGNLAQGGAFVQAAFKLGK